MVSPGLSQGYLGSVAFPFGMKAPPKLETASVTASTGSFEQRIRDDVLDRDSVFDVQRKRCEVVRRALRPIAREKR